MKITLADHYGMCFGVRDAIQVTELAAAENPVTVLGELVHNPIVRTRLRSLGAVEGQLDAVEPANTKSVIITAHGSAATRIQSWRNRGHQVIDTTCPLVKKAHNALTSLVLDGYQPVVIGKPGHAEVEGLVGDFPQAVVILRTDEAGKLPIARRYGVIAQTTQPLEHVQEVCQAISCRFPDAELKFVDTVCQPTKNRQRALVALCEKNDVIIVVGGNNSNNTAQLTTKARAIGSKAHQIESKADLQAEWFTSNLRVGVTAGTSTLPETVREVVNQLRKIDEAMATAPRQSERKLQVPSSLS